MAAQFIGAHMLVTLHEPPTRLRGVVSDVKSGHSLTLSNVWSVDTNLWLQPHITIQATNVANLVEIPTITAQDGSPYAPAVTATTTAPPAARPPVLPPADPAIIAVGKPPASSPRSSQESHAHVVRSDPNERSDRDVPGASREETPSAKLPASVKTLPVSGKGAVEIHPDDNSHHSPAHAVTVPFSNHGSAKKKSRRSRPTRSGRITLAQEETPESQPTATKTSTQTLAPTQASGPGSGGWRQTPILEDTASFQPFNSLRKSRGKAGNSRNRDAGWASEDVTDVQEMGEFDFERGLAKFDKHTLFDQLRKDDQVDESSRLVAHNRQQRPRPGTAGGKNLHYSENVLDMVSKNPRIQKEPPNDFWNSEADDNPVNSGERDRLSGRDQGSRQSSRRGESKMSTTRRSQSRKASVNTANVQGPSRAGSGVIVPTTAPGPGPSPGLTLIPSNRRVETVSALQMLNLENIAHNELGLTEEMMTENAGRGIAEVTLRALADPAVKLRAGTAGGNSTVPTSEAPPPTIAILAGNNKSGIRAVAAGRHLRNKSVNPLVCVVGMERGERDLLEGMRQQLRLFRNFGGHVYNKSELFEHVRKLSIPTLTIDTPRSAIIAKPPAVTLIIDALLGLATPFDELRVGEQATVYELIEWTNRNEAFVLAVDVPTGIDPSTGKVSIVDGHRLYVRPRYVVAMGAPKRGLLETISSSEAAEEGEVPSKASIHDDSVADWKLFVADVGLGPAVWKKAGTKMRRGIDFGNAWVVEMKYQSALSAAADA